MQDIIKKVSIIDGIIAVIIIPLIAVIPFKFVLIIILGLGIAYMNFAVNTIVTCRIMMNEKNGYALYTILSFVVRIIVVAGIGAITFAYNKYYVIAYLLGYGLHFISLMLYGTNAK